MNVAPDESPILSVSDYLLDNPNEEENVLPLLDCQDYETSDQNLIGQFKKLPEIPNIISNHKFSAPGADRHAKGFSSEEIIKAAGVQYMHVNSEEGFNLQKTFAVPALPREEQSGIELSHLLLSSAEMVTNQRYEEASRLLKQCKNFTSQLGNPVERLCYYFSEALQERIERRTCSKLDELKEITPDFTKNYKNDFTGNCSKDNAKAEFSSILGVCTTVLPFCKVLQFTAVQAIIDALRHGKIVHVIDFGIRTGCQWTALIQSLSVRSSSSAVKHLKITAVGMNRDDLEDSGRRLTEFAKSLSIPFSYCPINISKLEDINEGLFNAKAGEFVAVNVPTVFRTLLHDPTLLGNTVAVIRKLNPQVMVISEIEGQHNSPVFSDRFTEALLYYAAYFDCLEAVLPDRNDLRRAKYEALCCGSQLRNIIACEGEDRTVRHVKMDMWRSFLTQAGFREKKFSYQAWYQARLLLQQYVNGERFTIDQDGCAMTLGWNGRPLHSLSAWACKRT